MSDGESFAATGSGKSEAEIAFELVNKLKGQGVWGEKNISEILDMYAECLDATKGLRAYPGQNRMDAPIKSPAARSAAPQTQAQPAMQQRPAQPQMQPRAAAPQQQPVQTQQQAIQQAYKPA